MSCFKVSSSNLCLSFFVFSRWECKYFHSNVSFQESFGIQFPNYTQATEEEYVGKDWRTIQFRQDHSIQLEKKSYAVFMCLRAIWVECQHVVCHEFHEKHSTAQKRSCSSVLSDDDLNKSCHHQLYNLKLYTDIWWCTKEPLGGSEWSERAKGCAFCERMFWL